jgi:polyferredoxin
MRERVSTRVASYGNSHSNRKGVKVLTHNTVEEFRPGYPRYTALLSAHPSFHNFRRFTRTRLRLLLLKQDEIAVLEESLDKIDSAEECELFLGCRRRDTNPARQEILRQLKLSLAYHSQNPATGTSKV